ncbi:conserved hypothetical protein, membrane [Beggiatoa sp. PS]|nr:conserved hypothetical protein, membrane [Beggiatoa sp. PS]
MLTEFTFVSAFLAGLLGTTHCISMCGSIAGTLTLCLPANVHQSPHRLWLYLLIYNLGRISSYIVAGMLVGFLGSQFLHLLPLDNPHLVIKWISGLFMIALGLYLAEWSQTLAILEKSWRTDVAQNRAFRTTLYASETSFTSIGLWFSVGMVAVWIGL